MAPSAFAPDPTRSSATKRPRCAAWLTALALLLAPAPADAHEVVHVVTKGQTLYWLAKRYGTTVEAIRDANDLKPWQRLHPGLNLVIPDQKGKGKGAAKKAAEPSKRGATKKGADHAKPEKGKKKPHAEPRAATMAQKPKRRGFVRLVRGTEKLGVQLIGKRGHLAPAGLAGLSRMLRFYPTGAKIPIDPRLAALVAQVSDHFGGRPLLITSGYRPYSPAQHTPHSNHNAGRAIDFSVEGVPNALLRDFCRTFRNAGVGYYPNSTFVHLDVRTAKTYWVDYSRPGEAPHYDSPSAQRDADEAVRDVEPHAGAGDADPGSTDTQ